MISRALLGASGTRGSRRGVRPAQMRYSATSFAEISPEVILGGGVGNSTFLFDIEHSSHYKTAWMGFCKHTHTVLVLHPLCACARIFTFPFQSIDHARSFILYLPHEFVPINSDLPNLFTIVRQIGHVVNQAVSLVRPNSAFLNQCKCQSIFVEFIRKLFPAFYSVQLHLDAYVLSVFIRARNLRILQYRCQPSF